MTAPSIFIIDDHTEFRRLLGHHITTRWPDASVQHYDPMVSGRLPSGFSGAGADLVLLGHPAGQGDALEWLRRFRQAPRFPPVIFFGDGDERQIVAAIKAGAEDYIAKQTLSHVRLTEAMEQALGLRSEDSSPSGTDHAGLPSLRGYELLRELAVSDISTVYLSRERVGGRPTILKVLRQFPDVGGEKALARFLREYELIARVDHPNVVRIYELGVADDHAYIAMEYCSHGSLKRRIADGTAREHAFEYLQAIAAALGALHSVGILHRDLKPTNVMFREDESLALIDFGLAKRAHFKAELTGTGAIFGTPYYMSPEQGHAGDLDERSDLYSLGIIFYEMLVGQKPFDGANAMSVIIQQREAPVPSLPAPLAHFQPVIDRLLAKRPEDRFQNVAQLLAWRPEPPSGASEVRDRLTKR
jgi:serine/threonine protein kinase/CheY-like chemotaxis protein